MFIPHQQLNIAPGKEALILERRYNELVPKLKNMEDNWWYPDTRFLFNQMPEEQVLYFFLAKFLPLYIEPVGHCFTPVVFPELFK